MSLRFAKNFSFVKHLHTYNVIWPPSQAYSYESALPRWNYKIGICVLFLKQLSLMFSHHFSPKDLFWDIWHGEVII